MNTHFITLPSGSRLNSQYISHYRSEKDSSGIVIYTVHDEVFPEEMTLEQLDSLLSPPQSPIVSPVIDLDRLKPGAPVHFKSPSGEHRHGILEFIGTNYGSAFLSIRSGGEQFTIFPEQQNISK